MRFLTLPESGGLKNMMVSMAIEHRNGEEEVLGQGSISTNLWVPRPFNSADYLPKFVRYSPVLCLKTIIDFHAHSPLSPDAKSRRRTCATDERNSVDRFKCGA